MPIVILIRKQHLDTITFFVFPKHVILKRENNTCGIEEAKPKKTDNEL